MSLLSTELAGTRDFIFNSIFTLTVQVTVPPPSPGKERGSHRRIPPSDVRDSGLERPQLDIFSFNEKDSSALFFSCFLIFSAFFMVFPFGDERISPAWTPGSPADHGFDRGGGRR
jgi:hypothetical protein